MLPKKEKISRVLFPKFTDRKVVWNGESLRVTCYKKTEASSIPRFTVVVSKKQYTTTVARNLFKRRVFSILTKQSNVFSVFQFDRYVITPKLPVEKITFASIKTDIAKLILECTP